MGLEQRKCWLITFCARRVNASKSITLKSRSDPALPILSFKHQTYAHILMACLTNRAKLHPPLCSTGN